MTDIFSTASDLKHRQDTVNIQGPHCTETTAKMAKTIPCHEKHSEFGKFSKTGNFLILKIKDIAKFEAKISNFFKKTECVY